MASKKKYTFEIRQLDAWYEGENFGWTVNDSYNLGTFKTSAKDEKRAFLYALHKKGIVCYRGKCVVFYDGYAYELQNRKTGEPLFTAIPMDF